MCATRCARRRHEGRSRSGIAAPNCPRLDLIVIPGGFSYGDYLRCGAMAAHSPIMREVSRAGRARHAGARHLQRLPDPDRGGAAAGRAAGQRRLKFHLQGRASRVETSAGVFTARLRAGQVIRVPVAHHDGNYFADDDDARPARGRRPRRVPLSRQTARTTAIQRLARNIAGILNAGRNVLGLMPHPERRDRSASAAPTA